LIAGLAVVALATRVLFPGPTHEVVSPDGRRVVLWEEPEPGDQQYTHRLRVGVPGSRDSRVVMEFFRRATVEWSPSSRYLAITCWCGSDFAAVTIIDVEDPGHRLDAGPELQRRVGHLAVLDNHHAYIEAIGWITPSRVELRLWGYGEPNPKGFERHYSFPVRGKPILLSSRDHSPDER